MATATSRVDPSYYESPFKGEHSYRGTDIGGLLTLCWTNFQPYKHVANETV